MYSTVFGDTFELIARKVYGTEIEATRITQANPGVMEPLTPGISLVVPVLPGAPLNVPQAAEASNVSETAVLVDGERFRFWDSIRITRALDTIDMVEFGAPFEADAPGFREAFQPFSFKPLSVTIGGEPFFTGTMIGVNPVLENTRKTIQISGYSLPGVLNDCTVPASFYPKSEFNKKC